MSVRKRIGIAVLSLGLMAVPVVSSATSAQAATVAVTAKAVPLNVQEELLYAANYECSIKAAVAIDAPVIGKVVIETYAATPTTSGYVTTTVTASLAPNSYLLFDELVYLLPGDVDTDYCSGTPRPFQVKGHTHKVTVTYSVNFPPEGNWAQAFIDDSAGRPIACTQLYSVFIPTTG